MCITTCFETLIINSFAENIPNRSILIFFIILMKNYIFKTKCGDKKPNFTSFMNILKYKEKIELEIAMMNNKLAQHKKKWQCISS